HGRVARCGARRTSASDGALSPISTALSRWPVPCPVHHASPIAPSFVASTKPRPPVIHFDKVCLNQTLRVHLTLICLGLCAITRIEVARSGRSTEADFTRLLGFASATGSSQ